MSYKEKQREIQESLIKNSDLFDNVMAGKFYRGEDRDFILQDGACNIFNPIRDKVIKYFKENSIQWWGGNTPTGNTMSSQIACINHLFPLRHDAETLLKVLNLATNKRFTKLLPIPEWLDNKESSPHYVAFEAISKEDHLNENAKSRGSNCTSVDAMMIAEDKNGICLIPIEWKYTELYANDDKSNVKKNNNSTGKKRLSLYGPLICNSCQLKYKPSDYSGTIYFQEPFYQLMRQTIWTELSLNDFKAVNYIHLHVVPSGNKELLSHKYSRFPEFPNGMVDTWRSILRDPNRYICIDPKDIFAPIKEADSLLFAYLSKRYWQ